jgi:hypothetical protein
MHRLDDRPQPSRGCHHRQRWNPSRDFCDSARTEATAHDPATPYWPSSPHNPEGYYTIAVYYWDKTFRDKALNDATRHEYINSGMEAVNKAISIKPDYVEAIVYKGLLLRLEANMEKDRKRQADLLKEADALRDRAKALQKSKTQGAGD